MGKSFNQWKAFIAAYAYIHLSILFYISAAIHDTFSGWVITGLVFVSWTIMFYAALLKGDRDE